MTDYATPPGPIKPAELADIQGLIVRGYNLPTVRHFVLTIGDASAALVFLDQLSSGSGPLSITSAAPWPGGTKPDYALNIGITADGLGALKLPSAISFGTLPYGAFASFLQGAVAQAATVGDIGTNSPDNWVEKLNTTQAADAHVVLSLYTHTPEQRDAYSATLRTMFAALLPPTAPGATVLEWDVDAILETLPDERVQHKIHFGYTDGISNPQIQIEGDAAPRPGQLPAVEPWRFVTRTDAKQYKPPSPAEFGLNGSFSAFRILEQNVEAFDAFLVDNGGDSDGQEYLASKLCGRWRNGNPVVTQPDVQGKVLSDAELTDFDYGDDTLGTPCPYSAHTRRANPRGGPGVQGVHDQVSTRIMRRANPYGPMWENKPDGIARGLAGHFINASFANQFEHIMKLWVDEGDFSAPPNAGIDPLLGHIEAASGVDFNYYDDAKTKVTIPGLTQFVTTRGGLYSFLPSLTSLQWMAKNGNCDDPWTNPAR